ncbi:O-antigen ligase [Paucimonas lemoignei]|uniref:O-antigen ligase n=1 Tax=Paucimonas lemoignei TaxID=29443 RepID=A0A4R3HZR1_PAULE|nr:O-antigen ligase family protein [Paucimonas lemoignei]TCS38394.1 O-antigen ligase [Paucimonas lemoignei]
MSFAARRGEWPQYVLAILPFLLFFPVGIVYLGVVIFLFSLMLAGDYRKRWAEVRAHPMFRPVMAMLLVTCLAGIFLERPQKAFWSGFAHYQIYLFLLLFISVGKGEWQNWAYKAFIAGALYAAMLFYLNVLQLLPDIGLFNAYRAYSGNKSILLGILLAIAAGWLLYDMTLATGWKSLARILVAFIYIATPVLFLTKTRTAIVIFVLLCIVASVRYLRGHWRGAAGLLGVALIVAAAWGMSSGFKERMTTTFNDIVAFSKGNKPSAQGNRLEIYALTLEIIAQRPLTGHGISTWEPHYAKLATERDVDVFATPHNDYLLYAAEIGVIGVAALLWIWLMQLAVAWRMNNHHGMRLLMLGLAIMVGGMFNAILRDAVFGMAFMILLAIPLAGARYEETRAD